MTRRSAALAALLLAVGTAAPAQTQAVRKQADALKDKVAPPVVTIDTSEGPITVELYADKAPKTVENFLKYVDDGHYKDTIVHRVIGPNPAQPQGFMIQGGGIGTDMKEKATRPTIKNESGNGLSNTRGMIAMARKSDPNSASAQFYINLGDNSNLDSTPTGGYTVFGKVTEGMDVVDKIAKVATGRAELQLRKDDGTLFRLAADDVPTKPVVIKSIARKDKP